VGHSSGKSGRQRRVGVAVDEHHVGTLFGEELFEKPEHLARHLPVRPAADREVEVRLRDTELFEEHIRHLVVVVLPGVNEDLLVALAERPAHGSGLDELGTRPDD